jgi:chromate transporter
MPPSVSIPPAAAHPRPATRTELFVAFTILALQGFGGVLAVVQRELVERKRWLTHEEFVEDWAVAQILPGPNVVNLGIMLGARWFGPSGAAAAMAGLLTVPLALVLALAAFHARFAHDPAVAGALRGMAAVSAGLIAAAGLKLSGALVKNPIPLPWSLALVAAALVLLAWLRAPLAWVLPALGGLGCALAWRRLT